MIYYFFGYLVIGTVLYFYSMRKTSEESLNKFSKEDRQTLRWFRPLVALILIVGWPAIVWDMVIDGIGLGVWKYTKWKQDRSINRLAKRIFKKHGIED